MRLVMCFYFLLYLLSLASASSFGLKMIFLFEQCLVLGVQLCEGNQA